MSLESPNLLEKIKAWPYLKITLIAVGAVLVIGAFLYFLQTFDNWGFNRSQQKKKENINAALEEIKTINENVNAEKKKEQELIANIRRDAKDYLDAINATDASQERIDNAVNRMQTAANSNRNVNAQELEQILNNF